MLRTKTLEVLSRGKNKKKKKKECSLRLLAIGLVVFLTRFSVLFRCSLGNSLDLLHNFMSSFYFSKFL
jgi:hypothetical protein